MTNLYLIRHAESEANVDNDVYYTQNDWDIKLTELGKTQATNAGKKLLSLRDWNYENTLFISSPFIRAIQTRELIWDEFDKRYPHLDLMAQKKSCPTCVERTWGGLRDIIKGEAFDPDTHFGFYYQPPDGGESFFQCYQRVITFFQEIRSRYTHYDNIIITSHGEWIKLALMYLLEWDLDQFNQNKNPKNCQIIKITKDYSKSGDESTIGYPTYIPEDIYER